MSTTNATHRNETQIVADPGAAHHPDHPGVRRPAGARVPGVHRSRSRRPVARPASAHDADRPYDARSGGSYRYVHRDDDGTEYGFHGVFHEVRPHERIVQTFTFDGFPDGVSLETTVFEDLGGRTRVTGKSLMDSIEARDSMLKSGMERGVREGHERLDELLGGRQSAASTGTPRRALDHDEIAADEHRSVAGVFTDRVRGTDPQAWDNPAPCEGWAARDVVRHLVEWFPAFLKAGAGVELPKGPSVDDDPVAAWATHRDGVQALLDDPATARSCCRTRTSERCHWTRRSTGSTPPMSSCTPGTWHGPPARTSASTPPDAPSCSTGCCRSTTCSARAGSTDLGSRSPKSADAQTHLLAFIGRKP